MFATKHGSFGRLLSTALAGLFLATLVGCAGEDGNAGPAGPPGNTGGTGGTGGTGASGTLPLVDSNGITSVKFMTAKVSSVCGLVTTSTGPCAGVAADGRPVIKFTLTDENGVARKGLTAGSARIVMARLYPGTGDNSSEWRAYTNTKATPSAAPATLPPGVPTWGTTPALQATAEVMTLGTFTDNGDGSYTYRMLKDITKPDDGKSCSTDKTTTCGFDTTAPAYDATKTHRLGMEFRVYRNAAVTGCAAGDTTCSEDSIYIGSTNGVYTWRPSDGATTGIFTRDIAANKACDACHDQLNFHGGARSDVQYCVTCHNPYTTDPESDNTVDMKVMIHKIHRGSLLWNKTLGYTIVGYGGTAYDFTEVVFPQDQRNCETCHRPDLQATEAPDEGNWKKVANPAVCGTCHDGNNPNDTIDFWSDPTNVVANNVIQTVTFARAATSDHPDPGAQACLTCHGPGSTVDGGKWVIENAMFDPEERLAQFYKFAVVKIQPVNADGTVPACASSVCKVAAGQFPLVTAKATKCSVAYSSTRTCSGTETVVKLTDPEFGLNSSASMNGRVAWSTKNFVNHQPTWPTTSGWVTATVGTGTSAVPGTWVTAPILRGQPPVINFKPNLIITAATSASPIVFTTNASHSLQTGQSVKFAFMPGDFGTNLNGNTYTVTKVGSTTFSIAVDGSAFAAFGGYGGANYWTPVPAGMPIQAADPAVLNADGTYTRALAFPMPASSVGGTAEAFIEGRIYAMSAAQPSFTPIVTRLPIASSAGVIFNFNDASATARRSIVDVNRCNECHKNLSLHGSNRTSNTELCAACHNPENVQSAAVNDNEVFDFKRMIHRLHAEGFYWDDPIEELGYPGKLNDCEGCHKSNTYFPVDPAAVFATSTGSGVDPNCPTTFPSGESGTTRDATGAYKYPACVTSLSTSADDTAISPNAAICSGCHSSDIAETHMEQNGANFAVGKNADGSTQEVVETCPLCHGQGKDQDVKVKHRVAEYRYN